MDNNANLAEVFEENVAQLVQCGPLWWRHDPGGNWYPHAVAIHGTLIVASFGQAINHEEITSALG